MIKEDTAAQTVKKFYDNRPLTLHKKGSVIVLPSDERLPPVTYIETGLVGQYDITTEGNKAMVNIYKPGSFFPISSVVNGTFNNYYFEAITDIAIRQSPSAPVEVFLKANPAVVYELLKRLYSGIDGVLKRMVLLLGETAHTRLLYELFVFADRFGKKQPDGSVILDITAKELAQQAGLARETVSRELKKMKELKVLTTGRGKITLLSR
jgi:CRP/FNR family transcriptional regulator